ncbi:TPA: hypothetical protein ACGXVG_003120, partial [Listeria monocytogenes]
KTTPLIVSGELAKWGTLREINLVRLANRK